VKLWAQILYHNNLFRLPARLPTGKVRNSKTFLIISQSWWKEVGASLKLLSIRSG